MRFAVRLKKARDALDGQPASWRRLGSPVLYTLDSKIRGLIKEGMVGPVLDVGCGDQPYRGYVLESGSEYRGFDRERRTSTLDFEGDAEHMDQIDSESFGCVIATELLEHLRSPESAVAEFNRILVNGGRLIVSVPHLSRIHEAPSDYRRYTEFGLRHLIESQGLNVDSIVPIGGLFAFLGHQVSAGVLAITPLRLLRLGLIVNLLLVIYPTLAMDKLLRTMGRFPVGYVARCTKRAGLEGVLRN